MATIFRQPTFSPRKLPKKCIRTEGAPNLLITTLGPEVDSRYRSLGRVLKPKRLRFIDSIPNLLITTLSTLPGFPAFGQIVETTTPPKIRRNRVAKSDETTENLLLTNLLPLTVFPFIQQETPTKLKKQSRINNKSVDGVNIMNVLLNPPEITGGPSMRMTLRLVRDWVKNSDVVEGDE